jgi:hypothetical protein
MLFLDIKIGNKMHTLESVEDVKVTLPKVAHLIAGWPLLLILVGGAIGLALGVIAYLINLKVYKSELSKMNKVLANILCGMSAISLWWFIATLVQQG